MTYIIAEPCIDIKDRSCVDVCPVDCIHEFGRILIIDPEECIDCGACEPECPVEAMFPEDALPTSASPSSASTTPSARARTSSTRSSTNTPPTTPSESPAARRTFACRVSSVSGGCLAVGNIAARLDDQSVQFLSADRRVTGTAFGRTAPPVRPDPPPARAPDKPCMPPVTVRDLPVPWRRPDAPRFAQREPARRDPGGVLAFESRSIHGQPGSSRLMCGALREPTGLPPT